jgi:hypothetical protein
MYGCTVTAPWIKRIKPVPVMVSGRGRALIGWLAYPDRRPSRVTKMLRRRNMMHRAELSLRYIVKLSGEVACVHSLAP